MRKKTLQKIEFQKTSRLKQDVYARKKPKPPQERQWDARIRRAASADIKELTFLLENLPEKQLDQIFSPGNMAPFLKQLFSLDGEDKEARRKRVKVMLGYVLSMTGDFQYIADLIGPDTLRTMRQSENFNKNLKYLSSALRS